MKSILFLGTSLVVAMYTHKVARTLGYHPIFLLNINDYSGEPRRAIEACEHYEADITSFADVIRAIEENHLMDSSREVVAITSSLDEALGIALAVAQKFKIIGPDPALTQLIDKAQVCKMIPEFSPPTFILNSPDISVENIESFLNQNKSFEEFLLKPTISSGGVGISILNRKTAVNQIRNFIFKLPNKDKDKIKQNWIVQPRISGHLYSVEGYVKNGQPFFFGFSSRVRKYLTELVNEFPVDEDLPLSLRQKCQEAVETLVRRSGYRYGYLHCEFLINGNNFHLIDANMGRLCGGTASQHFAICFGFKPTDILAHVIDLGLFKGEHLPHFQYVRTNDKRTVAIYYCLPESAKVLEVILPSNLTSFHTQVAGKGKVIPDVGSNDNAWVGLIAGFKEQVLAEVQQLVINTDKGPMSPFYMLAEQ